MKKSAISLTEAAGLTISQMPQTLIREFDIALVVHELYAEKSPGFKPIKVRKHSADPSDISRVVTGLAIES